jgi:hypothetical protein
MKRSNLHGLNPHRFSEGLARAERFRKEHQLDASNNISFWDEWGCFLTGS